MKETDTLHALRRFRRLSHTLLIDGIIIGVLSGLIAILYRYLLGQGEQFIMSLHQLIEANLLYIAVFVITAVVLAIVIAWLIKAEPYISGSGIPQIEGEMIGLVDESWSRTLLFKFIGGTLATFGGLSLGREGPSIQLGALVAKGYARMRHFVLSEEKLLMTCGAAAGLSAAFNAPLAGVLFALEEIHRNFSVPVVLSVMMSAITGNFLSQLFFGTDPVFAFTISKNLPLDHYWTAVILAIITGLGGVIYNRATLYVQKQMQKWLPSVFVRLVAVFSLAAFFLVFCPTVLCGGHQLIEILYHPLSLTIVLLAGLLLLKFGFSLFSFGSGAPGGIFFPLLVMGSYIGAIFALMLNRWFGISLIYLNNFIILAMVGFFVAIVRAPITGIILITEMSGALNQLTALIIMAVIAYFLSDILKSEPIYESLLHRLVQSDKRGHQRKSKTKYFQEIAVEIDSLIADQPVKAIAWPNDFLLLAVKRGENEIIPDGDLIILSGDVLVFICDDEASSYVLYTLSKLTKSQKRRNE